MTRLEHAKSNDCVSPDVPLRFDSTIAPCLRQVYLLPDVADQLFRPVLMALKAAGKSPGW